MKNRFRLISYIIIVALFIPNITLAASNTVMTDNDTDWTIISWNNGRYEDGFKYHLGYSLTDGLKLENDGAKYKAIDAVDFKCDIDWSTGAIKEIIDTGSYYAFATDAEGNFVAYNAEDTTLTLHPWRSTNDNYKAIHSQFKVGEKANSGKPIVVAFDYKTKNPGNQTWMAAQLSFLGFNIYPNFQGTSLSKVTGIGLNNNSSIFQDVVAKVPVGENTAAEDWHTVKCLISPTLADNGKAEMTAIEVDGVVTQLNDIYGSVLDSDDKIFIENINARFMTDSTDRSLEIKNLTVSRGLDDIILSTDFTDGGEIGNEGINIVSSVRLAQNTMDGKIKVYDCDFDNELIADPGTVVKYNSNGANVAFTKLEGGGSYRMELTGVKDVWGREYKDTFSVSFIIPEGNNEEIKDAPGDEAGSVDINVGDIAIGSSNTLYHGHGFYEASKTDGEYEVVIDTAEWWNAEQNRYGKNNYFYYTDADGNEKLLGIGDENYNKLTLGIAVGETVNTGEPLVVSYDWYADNVGSVSEWDSYYMNVMGVWCYLSDHNSNETMLRYYEDGTTVAKKVGLGTSADGWHNMKIVFLPKVNEGRSQVTAVIIDGNITFYDGMYSTTNTYTDETFVMSWLGVNVPKPAQAEADNGDSIVKIRNLEVKRVDGLKAEIFMSLGLQNPEEVIKLNFNYAIPDNLTDDDFTIYELNGDTETAISNKLTVSKAYDDKQVVIAVGDGGLYYDKDYKLVINKNIIVEDYISITEKEYEFSTYEYPDDLTAELTKNGDIINYNISGGGDSFVIMVSTYADDGALVGLNSITAEKEGSGSRKKARGSVSISNPDAGTNVLVYIFSGDGKMDLYRMPKEF